MKAIEQRRARALRHKGFSVREITRQLGCSKSSISKWVRDISLSDDQIARLKSNQDRGRAKAAQHPNSPKKKWAKIREDIIESSSHEIAKDFSNDELKMLGAALYWAEGYKASRNVFTFSNSSPAMVQVMMKFLKDICHVPDEKLRGRISIHPHLNIRKAEKFWSKVSGISLKQFHKTQTAVSKASQEKRDTLPFGTFSIVISDTQLQSKVKGWIQGIENWVSLSGS